MQPSELRRIEKAIRAQPADRQEVTRRTRSRADVEVALRCLERSVTGVERASRLRVEAGLGDSRWGLSVSRRRLPGGLDWVQELATWAWVGCLECRLLRALGAVVRRGTVDHGARQS